MDIHERKEPITAAGVAGGGVLVVVGSLLTWITVGIDRGLGRAGGRFADRIAGRFGRSGFGPRLSGRGIDTFAGKAALVAGVILAMSGMAIWLSRQWRARRAFGVVAIAASAAVMAVVVDRLNTGPVAFGRAPRFLAWSFGPGIWIALAGAVIALAAAAIAAATSEHPVTTTSGPAADATPAGVPPSPAGPAAPPTDEAVATEPLLPREPSVAPPPAGWPGPQPEGSAA